ncbi:hypothetical protein AY606_00050 [Acinetobacter sp. SFB]|nr:hypothetical protein AY606_00050 [Acinetobacter sp. SFB]
MPSQSLLGKLNKIKKGKICRTRESSFACACELEAPLLILRLGNDYFADPVSYFALIQFA